MSSGSFGSFYPRLNAFGSGIDQLKEQLGNAQTYAQHLERRLENSQDRLSQVIASAQKVDGYIHDLTSRLSVQAAEDMLYYMTSRQLDPITLDATRLRYLDQTQQILASRYSKAFLPKVREDVWSSWREGASTNEDLSQVLEAITKRPDVTCADLERVRYNVSYGQPPAECRPDSDLANITTRKTFICDNFIGKWEIEDMIDKVSKGLFT
ncbi:hypothetical protein V866_002172 [Kwoniella sp. B9012]|uniref:uncharacterized protein n=1 Tax=Kwoniella botswanensis TaxID=1268659 RepID=UPI0030E4BCEC